MGSAIPAPNADPSSDDHTARIAAAERKFHCDRAAPRPLGHPGLSDLGL